MSGIIYPPPLLKDKNRLVNFDSSLGLKAAGWLYVHLPNLVTSADPSLISSLIECYGYAVECRHWESRALAKVVEGLTPEMIDRARKSVRKVLGSEVANSMNVHGIIYEWQAKLVESGGHVMEHPVANYDDNLDAYRKGKSKYFSMPSPMEKLLAKNNMTKNHAIDLILEDQLILFKKLLIPGFSEPYCCARGCALRIEDVQQAARILVLLKLTDDLIFDFHTFMDEGLPDVSWMHLYELILSVQTEIGWEALEDKVGVSPHSDLRFYFKDGSIVNA